LLRSLIGTRRVRIDDRNQRDTRALGLKLAQHTKMMATRRLRRPAHGHAQLGFACDFAASSF